MEGQLADTKITQRTINEEKDKILEPYYKRRNNLIEYIKTAQELLETSRKELSQLDLKHKPLLKARGLYVTKSYAIWNYIKDHPGLRHSEAVRGICKDLYPQYEATFIRGVISALLYDDNLRVTEGLYYAKDTYKKPMDIHPYGAITDRVKTVLIEKKSATISEILVGVANGGPAINRKDITIVLQNMVETNRATTNKTYEHQRDQVFTWIGETNV